MTQNPFEYNDVYDVHGLPLGEPTRSVPDSSAPVLQHLICFGFMTATLITGLFALASFARGAAMTEALVGATFCAGIIAYGLHHDYRWALLLTFVLTILGIVWAAMNRQTEWSLVFTALILVVGWLLQSHSRRRASF